MSLTSDGRSTDGFEESDRLKQLQVIFIILSLLTHQYTYRSQLS